MPTRSSASAAARSASARSWPAEPQPVADERSPGGAARERVELRAVARPCGRRAPGRRAHAQDRDPTAARAHQARHQVHERRLAGAVRPDEAGDARRQRERDAVDAQHFAVELRDVVEDDRALRAHDTTSRARSRLSSSHTQSAQMATQARPGGPRRELVDRRATSRATSGGRSTMPEQVEPDDADQVREVRQASPGIPQHLSPHLAERGAHEEDGRRAPCSPPAASGSRPRARGRAA